ncbi:RNA-dependent RNA polymerase [Halyomorpha halys negev-like virus 1]|uniref:RNA-dependent RNA polymerase n=1 Tax=Halyomorpha halys negev-like virus 1 TaxID=2950332 RepID=A0AAE9LA04_9VIRU|nr:RNA-dependent RNA polymerase [Halyomorpha halys negev-like virus 1]
MVSKIKITQKHYKPRPRDEAKIIINPRERKVETIKNAPIKKRKAPQPPSTTELQPLIESNTTNIAPVKPPRSKGEIIYAELDLPKNDQPKVTTKIESATENKEEIIYATIQKPHSEMKSLFETYYMNKSKMLSPTYKCHHNHNRSAWKLLEMLTLVPDKIIKGDILDICGAPGGFVSLLLDLGINPTKIDTFSIESDIKYYKHIIESKVNNWYEDIMQVKLEKKYDLILADGAIENSYQDNTIFNKELEVALDRLNKDGSIVIKHSNYYTTHFQKTLRDLAKSFNSVIVMKPIHSLITNSEIYIIANGFGESNTEPMWIVEIENLKEMTKNITREDKCNYVALFSDQQKRFSPNNNYPRLGIYDQNTREIDVDGTYGECCFLAATEDRIIDMVTLRKELTHAAGPKPVQDFITEIQPGNMAGSAVLEIMSKYFLCRYQIFMNGESTPYLIPFPSGKTPFRIVNLVLKNHHYYIKNICRREAPLVYRRDRAFEPLNITDFTTRARKVLRFKEQKWGDIDSSDDDGCYFYNNLSIYCNIHEECRNNNLLTAIERLEKHITRNLSFLMLFETDNYSIDYTEKLLKDHPTIAIRYLDIPIKGYFCAIIHIVTTPPSVSLKDSYDHFRNHKCATGSNVNIDVKHNILYTCDTEPQNLFNGPYQQADYLIRIVRSEDPNPVRKSTPRKLEINGYGQGAKAINMHTIAAQIVRTIGMTTPKHFNTITVESDYSNLNSIIPALKQVCGVLVLVVHANISPETNFLANYLPDNTEINKRKNAMLEVYSIWYRERYVVETALKSGYNTVIPSLTGNAGTIPIVDISLCVYDINAAKFVYGVKPNPPYSWGFDGDNLINTESLFCSKGNPLNQNLKQFRRRGVKYIVFNSASKLMHGISLSSNHSVSAVDNLKLVPITFVQGVPGGGKTTYILNNNKDSTNNLILTVTREARDDMTQRAKDRKLALGSDRIRTVDSFLLNYLTMSEVEEVWIDEALLVHCGIWCWISLLSNCKRMIVVGDIAQIPYINRSGLEIHYNEPQSWKTESDLLKIDYRNPLDIVHWLHTSGYYTFPVTGTSKITYSTSVVNIGGVADIPRSGFKKYLTFTQSEKTQLVEAGFDACTIHEYQGSQATDVALVRLNQKDADTIYKSRPHILVALTRHTNSFRYYTVIKDTTYETIGKISSTSLGEMKTVQLNTRAGGTPIINPDKSITLYQLDRNIRNAVIDSGGSGYQNWNCHIKHDFKEIEQPLPIQRTPLGSYAIQDYIDRIYPTASAEFNEYDHYNFEYHGKLHNVTDIAIGASLPAFKKYDRLKPKIRSTIQHPLHRSQRVSLKAFYERNGQVPQLQGLVDAYYEAEQLIVDLKKILPRYKSFMREPINLDYRGLEEWLEGQPPYMKKILSSSELFQDTEWSLYEFILKSIPKIDLDIGSQFRYKAPQTIAYQPKIVNAVFCPVLKNLTDRFEFSLHEDIVFYNGMSSEEFAQLLTKRLPLKRYNMLKRFLEIDFSKYDKSQGLIILIFEAMLMEMFGVNKRYIILWILMHRYTRVKDRFGKITAYIEYQRKSGDAATWRFNTIVQLAILNRVLRLYVYLINGQAVCCFSGDDSCLFVQDFIEDVDLAMRRLQNWYNLEAKLMNFTIPYFCSKFLLFVDNKWIFVPDTIKLLIKLGRSDMVDYEHVEAYRISFADNLYYYKFTEYWPTISDAINDRYKTIGEHDLLFETLLSTVRNSSSFAELYRYHSDHIFGKVSTKPKLEL